MGSTSRDRPWTFCGGQNNKPRVLVALAAGERDPWEGPPDGPQSLEWRSFPRQRSFIAARMTTRPDDLLPLPADADEDFGPPYGLFDRRRIRAMARRKLITAAKPLDAAQFQPASLDLRLGREAYRVRASFLPGRGRSVKEHLASLDPEPVSLVGDGAVL